MKKRFFICLCLLVSLLAGLTAAAHADAQIENVSDYAGILTTQEREELSRRAAQLSDQYDFGVFIVIVNNYKEYVNGGIANFSEEIFHRYGLGRGEKEEGVILAMSMDERDFDIYAHGNFGNYAFTDYGKGQLANSFLDDFRRNDWAGGFRDFIETSGEMLQKAKDGNPVDTWVPDPVERGPRMTLGKLLASLGIGCFTGYVSIGSMKRSMKTAVRQSGAANYVARGGVNLRIRRDDLINRVVNRRPIPRPTPGGRPGGGHFGGTTISGSHGGSHHSGKF